MLNLSVDKTYALFASGANKKTIAELEKLGAETLLFPNIKTEIVSESQVETIISGLENFDWLVFTDVYTVEYFLQKLEEKEIDLFGLDELRVLAFGESVSDRLRFAQLHADVITNSIKTLEVMQSFKDYICSESEFENLRVLVLKEENAKTEIVEELNKLGSIVTGLVIYRAQIEEDIKFSKLKALLKGGAVDEFIFSSPLDVINLSHIFQTENLDQVLAETKLTTTDKQTWQTLEEFRLT